MTPLTWPPNLMPTSPPRAPLLAVGTLLVLVALLPGAAGAGGGNATLGEAADAAYLGLAADVLGHEPPPGAANHPREHLRTGVLEASRVPANETVQAWENATPNGTRAHLGAAEAALLDLSSRNVDDALAKGNVSAALAWLGVLDRRAWSDLRLHPAPDPNRTYGHPPEPAPDRGVAGEDVREAADAALAARARELAVQALLLDRAGQRNASAASAATAAALVEVLEPRGLDRLQPELRAPLRENATEANLTRAVREAPGAGERFVLTGVLAPLASLEMDHKVEPLEEWAVRNLDAAVAAARASVEDPRLAEAVAREAYEQYQADRGLVGLAGEGTNEAADAAFLDLRNATHAGDPHRSPDPEALRAAAANASAALRDLAVMEHGLVVKVTTGGVQPDRTHRYKVTLVKPPLEGLGEVPTFEVTWKPEIVHVAGVEAADEAVDVEAYVGNGTLSFNATFEPPANRSLRAVHLLLEARGPPESTTNLTVEEARFAEADGDPVPVLRVRDGQATVANVTAGAGEPVEDEPPHRPGQEEATRGSPLPAWLAAAGLAAGALLPRRRRGA